MDATCNLELTSPSSSSSFSNTTTFSSPSPITWDVFLSFYGKDTRGNFISHLYKALDEAGFVTFKDDPALRKGEEISRGLHNAIKESKMFVVVISENYARSRWCLDELVQILSLNKTENKVVPVFYYVDPSHVRYQKENNFREALEAHKKHYSDDMIDKWKTALAQIADLSGHHLRKDAKECESETIQEIVENVAQASFKLLDLEEHLFGIDSAVEEIYQKLRMESDDVRGIGICGMGGIGKTTTAKAFYNKYFNIFDISCFIDNVQQYSQRGSPLLPLLKKLLTQLLRKKDCEVTDVESGMRQLKRILNSKKVLIVLDGLDQSSYSNFVVRICNLVSVGSRIIITTRDVHLLNQLKVDMSKVDIYMVKKLEQIDALELFSYHAFGKSTPTASLKQLSVSFVTHAGGLPLALKVLGSLLRGRTQVSFWEAKLEEVQEIPVSDIQRILQVSYDNLSEMEKAIFLDIAFFFVGKDCFEADEIFQSCGFCPKVGIPILAERCLLEIDKNDRLQMHNLIIDMGRDLGKSTRLSWKGNAWNDLQHQEGMNQIEGLVLDLTQSTEKQINSRIFEKLPKLRLLEIINAHGIRGHINNSFDELRSIRWSSCTWKQLPCGFQPQKLVSLHMPYSNFKILWNGAMPLKSLKMVNLSYSVNLKMTPDFGNSKLVERLFFRGCEGLLKLHPSIRDLTGLHVLDLGGCSHLKELAEPNGQFTILGHLYSFVKQSSQPMKQWPNMEYLNLAHCHKLRTLPEQLGDMKELKLLDASYTAIEELPDSIVQLKKLVILNLNECSKLRMLPEKIGNMQGLRTFRAGNSAIEQLPDSFVDLVNLERLELSYCKNLKNLPNGTREFKLLKMLNLEFCSKLERLPEELGKMQCLEYLNVPMKQWPNMEYLNLAHCHKLRTLLEQLGDMKELKLLDASYTAIEELPDSIVQLKKLVILNLNECSKLRMLPEQIGNMQGLRTFRAGNSAIEQLPDSFVDLVNLERLELSYCKNLKNLPNGIREFKLLKMLNLEFCSKLERLPEELGKMQCLEYLNVPMKQWPNMEYLNLAHCHKLRTLPEQLGDMKELKLLDASYTAIEELPDSIVQLKKLVILNLNECSKLRMLPEQIGNMQGLRTFRAGNSAIEQLPDSFVDLVNLERLELSYCKNLKNLPNGIREFKLLKMLNLEFCSKLERLPEELGKMQCLEYLNVSHTAIEQLPDSIGRISRLRILDLSWCEKLKYMPNSIWNLTSLTNLDLLQADTGRINLPDKVKNTKLVALSLKCDISLWLHRIVSFSSLKQLCLCDESESLSLTEPFSLSKLSRLQSLELYKFTSIGTSFPELPPTLTHLSLCYHATLVHLLDLSSLKQVKKLDIIGYVSIKSLPPLPPHLRSLTVYDCTSLQDQSDMSRLKDLVDLSFGKSNPESISLKQSFLQVIRQCLPLFKADVPRIADWLSYKSSGCTLCFNIPPLFGDNFLGLAIWVLFTSKYSSRFNIEAVITNKTNGMKEYYRIPVYCIRGAAAYSLVKCIRGDEMSVTSGDSIEISFERQLYSFAGEEVPFEVNIEMCAAQVIQKSPFTPNFPSAFNLIDGV